MNTSFSRILFFTISSLTSLSLAAMVFPKKTPDQIVSQRKLQDDLNHAIRNGNKEEAAFILERGANINYPGNDGYPPLMTAVDCKQTMTLVEWLLDQGAMINLSTDWLSGDFTPMIKQNFPLKLALQRQTPATALMLIERGADPNRESQVDFLSEGGTPLLWAAEQGYVDVAKLLLRKKAKINHITKGCTSPLFIAIERQHAPMIRLLVQRGARLEITKEMTCGNEEHSKRESAQNTARWFFPEMLSFIMQESQERADWHSRRSVKFVLTSGDRIGYQRGLQRAANDVIREGKTEEEVYKVLRQGADLNFTDDDGHSPLTTAVFWGHITLVEWLLDNEADIDLEKDRLAQDPFSTELINAHFPLKLAIQNRFPEIARLLLERGANPKRISTRNTGFSDRETPLFWASECGYTDIVRLLLAKGAAIDASDYRNVTPLMNAARCKRVETARVLIEAGATVDCQNRNEETALDIAKKEAHAPMIELLTHAHSYRMAAAWKKLKVKTNYLPRLAKELLVELAKFYNSAV